LNNINISIRIIAVYLVALLVLPSCNSTKFLKEGEVLLTKAEIIIQNDTTANLSAKEVTNLKLEMEQFYQLAPNGNTFYGRPREHVYYKKYQRSDSLGRENLKNSKIAEIPALLDYDKIEGSALDMQNYLRNKKGFYNATVRYDVTINNKKAKASYTIRPHTRYRIKKLEYVSKDSTLVELIETLSKNSLIKSEDPVDALNFNLEKQRIVTELQNSGYANFNLNYIGIEGDSTSHENGIDIRFNIFPPTNNRSHTKFKIGDIKIFTDYNQFQNVDSIHHEPLFSKEFYRQSQGFLVKPAIIDNKIFLKKNKTYRADDYFKTIRKLYTLSTYRFAKVSSVVSQESDTIIDYRIFLTPQRSRWVLDLNNELFYSNISRTARNLIGIAAGTSLENRNTFKGAETYTLGIESGVELNVNPNSNRRLVTTFTLGVNNNLEIPRVTKTFNIIPLVNKIGLLKDKALTKLYEEGSTQINLGYNFVDILDFYRIGSFNATYGFEFKINNKNRVVFNQVGLNITLNTPRDSFQVVLDTVPLLNQSFQSTLFSGLIFRDLTYYYQSDKPKDLINYTLISNLEFSGLEVFVANRAFNAIASKNNIWQLNGNQEFAKFVKFEIDNRWFKNFKRGSQLAWRIRGGVAVPYGDVEVVSWLKQFSVGGPNSLRAWRPMELGPGSFEFPATNIQNFFQRADVLLEFGVDYRFDLFWLLEGALFFDGGNIWTLEEDLSRPGAKISTDFINQIALGYGYGLRFDFTYFLIRFDFGFRLRNPSRRIDNNQLWVPLKGQPWHGNINIAVNYPF
jgi:hypothetical protein